MFMNSPTNFIWQGIDAEFISLHSIIEGDSNTVLDQPFYDDLAARMAKAIDAAGNKVPVVTGERCLLTLCGVSYRMCAIC